MTTPDQLAWVDCAAVGCHNGRAIDYRHARNFVDRWLCPEHEGDQQLGETPC